MLGGGGSTLGGGERGACLAGGPEAAAEARAHVADGRQLEARPGGGRLAAAVFGTGRRLRWLAALARVLPVAGQGAARQEVAAEGRLGLYAALPLRLAQLPLRSQLRAQSRYVPHGRRWASSTVAGRAFERRCRRGAHGSFAATAAKVKAQGCDQRAKPEEQAPRRLKS